MDSFSIKFFCFLLLILSLQACNSSDINLNKKQIVVKIDTQKTKQLNSNEFIGLSYETKQLLPDKNGEYYFRPDNTALLNMFQTLGIKNLRIGGNSVDAATVPIPEEKDIQSFFDFAKAAGVKVIYSVRLQNGDPKSAQNIAKFIHDNYKDVLESFAIGNEPSYYRDYDMYISKWTAIRDAIIKVFPDAVFSGPDQNPDAVKLKKLVDDFGYPKDRLVQITQHNYPFGCSYTNYQEQDVRKLIPFDAKQSREKMLADSSYNIYNDILQGMLDATKNTQVSFRLSETNSYWYSGLKGASDSYASALWGLDYMHWWASHGLAGLNFHTGDTTGGEITLPCRYAAFVFANKNYEAKPLAYGIKSFSLGKGGKGLSLSTEISSSSDGNLVAYANRLENNEVFITLINKEYKSNKEKKIHIQLNQSISPIVKIISLNALNNDIAAEASDITIGGAQISSKGTWNGKWEKLPGKNVKKNKIIVDIASASAVILKVIII